MDIQLDDPARPAVAALLREHLADMALHSPPESIHALDVEALRVPSITFWTASEGDTLLGCAALSALDAQHGEVKSMRTATAHRRKAVAATLLGHLLLTARQRGYTRLSLETGSMAAFAPARALYERHGFSYCGPFGRYQLDPHSVFMTRLL
jgi:putative acetyltransferase